MDIQIDSEIVTIPRLVEGTNMVVISVSAWSASARRIGKEAVQTV